MEISEWKPSVSILQGLITESEMTQSHFKGISITDLCQSGDLGANDLHHFNED